MQAAQINIESKACKRVFFSSTQENFFPSLPFLLNLFSKRKGFVSNLTDSVPNVNLFRQSVCGLDTTHLRTGRRASGNMRLASCGVTVANSTVVFQINFSAGLTVLCPEIPHELQGAMRLVSLNNTNIYYQINTLDTYLWK